MVGFFFLLLIQCLSIFLVMQFLRMPADWNVVILLINIAKSWVIAKHPATQTQLLPSECGLTACCWGPCTAAVMSHGVAAGDLKNRCWRHAVKSLNMSKCNLSATSTYVGVCPHCFSHTVKTSGQLCSCETCLLPLRNFAVVSSSRRRSVFSHRGMDHWPSFISLSPSELSYSQSP